jgi:signal transduction histidine kinase
MNRIEIAFKYFLHPSFSRSVISHRKGMILVFSHFYVFLSIASLFLLSDTIKNVSFLPTLCALPCILISLFFFKKKGNVNLSGNILTILLSAVLIPILLKTGGINSSFMPWLYTITFIMVLVESLIWATMWFVLCSLFCLSLFMADSYYPTLNISNCTKFDSMIAYLSVGFFLFLSLIVFEGHQVFIIKRLRSKNEELRTQKAVVAEHLTALEKVSNQLSASNQELATFAYAASHDLKEPLRMIKMYTQIIEMKLKPVLNDATKEYMGFVTDGVKRMQNLLDNLLEYSLLDKKDKKLEDIDLNKKLESVLLNLTVVIQETEAQINVSTLPTITAEPTEMAQLFQNVISNALKFRKKDIAPIINISCTESEDEYMFIIEDNGIGIKTEDQERIFNLFTRLHTNAEYEGTGIGLATCKKILTGLHGKISVSSVEGKGTTFYFIIPKINVSNTKEEAPKKYDPMLAQPKSM